MSEEGRTISQDEKMAMLNQLGGKGQPKEVVKEEEKETVIDEKTETVDNEVEKTEDKQVEEKQSEEKPDFDISVFNKVTGREFENLDALNTLFEKADGYDKTKSEYDETLQKLSEYKNLAEGVDPMSYFANEDEYVRQQFLKKHSDNIGEDARKALSVLSPSKIKELEGVDALKLNLMVNDDMTGEEADAYLQKKYDVDDFNYEDLELGVKATIKKDVNDAKKELGKLYEGIEIPSKVDYETARTQLKESWETPLKDIVEGIDKIQLEEGVDFIVTKEMKEGLIDDSMRSLLSKQTKPSEEAAASLVGQLKEKILLNNIDKVIKSIKSDLEESIKASVRAEIHNDKPFKEDVKSKTTDASNEDKMRKFL